MEATYFPIEIKNYFLKHQIESNNEEQDLINIFANESVKEAFIGWTRAHQSVVEYTPRLYRTLNLATGSSVEWDGVAKLIHSIYLWFSDDGAVTLLNQLLIEKQEAVFFPDNYIVRTLELYESGIIDLNKLIALFAINNHLERTPLHDAIAFQAALPFLKKLEIQAIVAILSIKVQFGQSLLECYFSSEIMIDLLKNLNNQELVSIFSIQNEYGDCLLHDLDLFRRALPLLKNLNIQELYFVLSIKNHNGECPFDNSKIFTEMLDLLDSLSNRNALYEFLLIKSHGENPLLPSSHQEQIKLMNHPHKQSIFQLIAEEIMKTPGFVKVPKDSGKHIKNINSETFSESQGGDTLCQKIADFGANAFNALSLEVLAGKRHIDPSLYYILFMKRLSHALSLKGQLALPNGMKRHVEGFDESFTVPMLSHTFLHFLSKVENGYSLERQAWMKNILTTAIWHQNVTDRQIDDIHQILQSAYRSYPIIIASGWDWHSTQIVFDEYDHVFYCNCGEDSIPGEEILEFSIKDKTQLTPDFLKKLIYRTKAKQADYVHVNNLLNKLSGKHVKKYTLPQQTAGTCTYTNMLAALYVLLILWQRKDRSLWITEFSPKELHENFVNYDIEMLLLQFIEELKFAYNEIGQPSYQVACVQEMKQLITNQFKFNQKANINARVAVLFDKVFSFGSCKIQIPKRCLFTRINYKAKEGSDEQFK